MTALVDYKIVILLIGQILTCMRLKLGAFLTGYLFYLARTQFLSTTLNNYLLIIYITLC